MATPHGNFSFTGSLGPVTAYTMRGCDRVVMRAKGGPKKRRIKVGPEFEVTRQLNNEWKGVTMAASFLRSGLYGLLPVADYNVTGPLNALVKKIQNGDTENPKGKRSILFSRQPDFISNFNFNKQNLFDSVVRQPLAVNMDKTTGIINVTIPALQPAVNFFAHPFYVYFRFILDPSVISDYILADNEKEYIALNPSVANYKTTYTPWAPTAFAQPSAEYQISSLEKYEEIPSTILIFGAGIQYGVPAADGSIQPAPYAGAARVLKSI